MEEAGISPTQLFLPSVYWENKWQSALSKTSFQNGFAPKSPVSPYHDISPLVLLLKLHRYSICNEISLLCLLGTSWNRKRTLIHVFPSLWPPLNRNAIIEPEHWLEDKTSSCKGGPSTLACRCPPPAGKIIPDKQQQGNVQQINLTDEPWTLVSINAC